MKKVKIILISLILIAVASYSAAWILSPVVCGVAGGCGSEAEYIEGTDTDNTRQLSTDAKGQSFTVAADQCLSGITLEFDTASSCVIDICVDDDADLIDATICVTSKSITGTGDQRIDFADQILTAGVWYWGIIETSGTCAIADSLSTGTYAGGQAYLATGGNGFYMESSSGVDRRFIIHSKPHS